MENLFWLTYSISVVVSLLFCDIYVISFGVGFPRYSSPDIAILDR